MAVRITGNPTLKKLMAVGAVVVFPDGHFVQAKGKGVVAGKMGQTELEDLIDIAGKTLSFGPMDRDGIRRALQVVTEHSQLLHRLEDG